MLFSSYCTLLGPKRTRWGAKAGGVGMGTCGSCITCRGHLWTSGQQAPPGALARSLPLAILKQKVSGAGLGPLHEGFLADD